MILKRTKIYAYYTWCHFNVIPIVTHSLAHVISEMPTNYGHCLKANKFAQVERVLIQYVKARMLITRENEFFS